MNPTAATIRIDKGIPIPPLAAQPRYPLRQMDVGDSFFVPCKGIHGTGLYNGAVRAGIRVTVRKVDGGLRCWRTQ